MPTTWNPSDKGLLIALSVGNHVATTTGGGNAKVRGTTSHGSGKWYLEYPASTIIAAQGMVGFGAATVDLNNNALGDSAGLDAGGTLYSAINSAALGFDPNAHLSFAIDLDNLQIWCREDGGDWNGSPAADPSTNTGGLTMTMGTDYYPLAFLQDVGPDASTTLNAGDSTFTYGVPSGFVGWDAPAPDPEEFFGVVIS